MKTRRILLVLGFILMLILPLPSYAKGEYLIGHRGLSGMAPDNTMAGINLALNTKSIKGVAVDPRITKDGKLVLCHDATVK